MADVAPFEERTILVTGGSRGIGFAVARLLVDRGARVVIAARGQEGGVAAADALGARASFLPCDFSDPAGIAALFAAIDHDHGRLDAAVNNAAMTQDSLPIRDTPTEMFDALMALNLRGTWLCVREELRRMIPAGRGAIVNVASVAALRGYDGLSLYCASKHAVIGLTRVAALEGGPAGVRVNCACPGTTRTGMMERQMLTRTGGMAGTLGTIPLGRLSEPEEQAAAIAWLLSDEASFVNGEIMAVDGGRSAH